MSRFLNFLMKWTVFQVIVGFLVFPYNWYFNNINITMSGWEHGIILVEALLIGSCKNLYMRKMLQELSHNVTDLRSAKIF